MDLCFSIIREKWRNSNLRKSERLFTIFLEQLLKLLYIPKIACGRCVMDKNKVQKIKKVVNNLRISSKLAKNYGQELQIVV